MDEMPIGCRVPTACAASAINTAERVVHEIGALRGKNSKEGQLQ